MSGILPAREMLGDLLLEMNRPKDALIQYELSLKNSPNRFNTLYGLEYLQNFGVIRKKLSSISRNF
jgi:hypothetical protein